MELSLYIAGIVALGIVVQWLAWRTHLPAIVLLLLSGFVLGQITDLGSDTDSELFFALVSLSVGVILFEGGLNLDFREIKGVRGVVLRLVSLGLLATWLLSAWLAHRVAGFSTEMALVLGALLTVSGPTVIMPLLRQVQPAKRIGSLIKWEGIVNDPIGAVLAAIVFELVLHRNTGSIASESMTSLGLTLLTAIVLSTLCAWLLIGMLRRFLVPDFLQNPLVLALVVFLFALSNQLQEESGLVTITLLGVILANQHSVDIHHIVEFKENLRTLLISMLFIVLAARLDLDAASLQTLGWGGAAFVALLIVLVRPVAVLVSTLGSPLTWKERILLAWMHPRGIVAAAVSSLFALELARVLGPDDPLAQEANRFMLVTFLVIVGTVAVYGLTVSTVARKLGLSRQNPQGILFAGASRAVREIATALQEEEFSVLLVDTNLQNNSAARMAGLPVIYASIGSELVRERTDLGGIGRILAMTPNDEVNTLAAMEYAELFGRSEVYQVAIGETKITRAERGADYRRGRAVFERPMTSDELEHRFAEGHKIKKTVLTEDFSFDDFRQRYGQHSLVLFVIDENRKLRVVTGPLETPPRAGQKVIALIDPDEEQEIPATVRADSAKQSGDPKKSKA